MSNTLSLHTDIEMSNRAKQAVSRLRVLSVQLEEQSHDLRRSKNIGDITAIQGTIAQINTQHSIIARAQQTAQAAIAAAVMTQGQPPLNTPSDLIA